MARFWDLLPASLLGRAPSSGWPYGDPFYPSSPFVGAPQAGGNNVATPMAASVNQPRGSSEMGDPVRPPTATFWDLLPATPHARPFIPMMPPGDRFDPWGTPATHTALTPLGAQISSLGVDRASGPGFLGLALGPSATSRLATVPSAQQPSGLADVPDVAEPRDDDGKRALDPLDSYSSLATTPSEGKDLSNPPRPEPTTPSWFPDVIHTGIVTVPTSWAGVQQELDSFDSAFLGPMNDLHGMMQPPLRPPPGAFVDARDGHVWIDDVKGGSHLWENVDPDAAYAYYADQQRRAEFAPKFALGLIGGGASLATRNALGMAGGRLIQPALTGQTHHGISKLIHNALEESPLLAGFFKHRDPRFETKAINLGAHKGWEAWHRDLDNEIAAHIRACPSMTTAGFVRYLRNRYRKKDLLWRFPNGFRRRL